MPLPERVFFLPLDGFVTPWYDQQMGRGHRDHTSPLVVASGVPTSVRIPAPPWADYEQPNPTHFPVPVELTEHAHLATHDGTLLGAVVIGSHAYCTSHPDSDLDVRGIWQAPTNKLLGLPWDPPSIDVAEPDITAYELGQFAKLASGGNPNILEMLWAPQIGPQEPLMEYMRQHRTMFLSSEQVLRRYGGYAMGQLQQAKKGSGGSRGVKHFRREKFLIHLFRLAQQGTQLLAEGDMDIRLADRDRIWELAHEPLDRVEVEWRRIDAQMKAAAANSPLPERPDYERINDMLVRARLERLED